MQCLAIYCDVVRCVAIFNVVDSRKIRPAVKEVTSRKHSIQMNTEDQSVVKCEIKVFWFFLSESVFFRVCKNKAILYSLPFMGRTLSNSSVGTATETKSTLNGPFDISRLIKGVILSREWFLFFFVWLEWKKENVNCHIFFVFTRIILLRTILINNIFLKLTRDLNIVHFYLQRFQMRSFVGKYMKMP